jgi:hypothetical protein
METINLFCAFKIFGHRWPFTKLLEAQNYQKSNLKYCSLLNHQALILKKIYGDKFARSFVFTLLDIQSLFFK